MFSWLKFLVPKRKRYRYRDAITGKLVSKTYAEENPDTTVRERK
jgi:hypothetical protein